MAILTVSGLPESRFEEAAHGAAHLLGFDLVTEARLEQWFSEEFGQAQVPPRAWRYAAASVVARLAASHNLVIALPAAERLLPPLPIELRAGILASPARRMGNLMLRLRLEQTEARTELARLDQSAAEWRRRRWGRAASRPESFDLILSADRVDAGELADVLAAAARARRLPELGMLAEADQAGIQFEARLRLARYGIVPAERAHLKVAFSHASEELFANLLDFYRIEWVYEPRSFPLQWDKDGNVIEAFTPDFYLPEFDLYVELTTMKQSLVTRKNRKVKMLRAIYPHVNVQVFYQKDFQDLVYKHGLRG
jgi:hypothetical protein